MTIANHKETIVRYYITTIDNMYWVIDENLFREGNKGKISKYTNIRFMSTPPRSYYIDYSDKGKISSYLNDYNTLRKILNGKTEEYPELFLTKHISEVNTQIHIGTKPSKNRMVNTDDKLPDIITAARVFFGRNVAECIRYLGEKYMTSKAEYMVKVSGYIKISKIRESLKQPLISRGYCFCDRDDMITLRLMSDKSLPVYELSDYGMMP